MDFQKKLTIINDEFEKLYGMVENKESQIKKLEKIIGQMEKHEEYSQAQRTRMEQRIAKLETALKEGQQAHRYVETPPLNDIRQVDLARCDACPVRAKVAAYSSSGCSSDLMRQNPSYERFYGARRIKRATLPVYKWFLKPFFRESSNHVVYNRHLKNIGIVREADKHHHRHRSGRHHERKVRVAREPIVHSYEAPVNLYYN